MMSPRAAPGQPWGVRSVPGLEVVWPGSGIRQPEPTRELRYHEGNCPKCEATYEPAESDFDAQEHRAAALPCTMFSACLPRNHSEITCFPCCDCSRALVHPARAAEAPHLEPHLLSICDEQHGLQTPTACSPGARSSLPGIALGPWQAHRVVLRVREGGTRAAAGKQHFMPFRPKPCLLHFLAL